MAFIFASLISALLFITVEADPIGKYSGLLSQQDFAVVFYIKEDNTVYASYRCSGVSFLVGPYRLRPGSGADEYSIFDVSSPGSALQDRIRGHCPDFVLLDGDLVDLSFASDERSLTFSSANETVTAVRVDNSGFTPYYATYQGLKIGFSAADYKYVTMKITCGDAEVNAYLQYEPYFGPDNTEALSKYVIISYAPWLYENIKSDLADVCGFELLPDDLKAIEYVTSTTAYTELGGERLTLTAI
ncbi:hypothetical protein FOZ63_029741 [Perkinsus olseni]|uniref:Uncharacterized protein n=1 Tax=Perkinsus olseni TaxID=32597 RepID=A0A7J6RB69_PEROL|nr:hypothetical protein FOZ60_010036 [Perkinsus olseni]KAF4717845.1 hypothetical protein FOZ62_003757 [Perkinsus olseni]KAF4736652.1 hypothetical protein FOZ63_029741 [Perkinsus olseni]